LKQGGGQIQEQRRVHLQDAADNNANMSKSSSFHSPDGMGAEMSPLAFRDQPR
jgi:hypothetical protein